MRGKVRAVRLGELPAGSRPTGWGAASSPTSAAAPRGRGPSGTGGNGAGSLALKLVISFLGAIFVYCIMEQKWESVWLSWMGKWAQYYDATPTVTSPSDKKTEETPLRKEDKQGEEEKDPSRPKTWWAA